GADHARSENDKAHVAPQAAVDEQGQIVDGLGRHDLSKIGALRLEQRSCGGNLDRLVERAERQHDIQIADAVHIYSDPGSLRFSKAGLFSDDGVIAHWQVRNAVNAVRARLGRLRQPRIGIPSSHDSLGDGGPRWVSDRSPNRSPVLSKTNARKRAHKKSNVRFSSPEHTTSSAF